MWRDAAPCGLIREKKKKSSSKPENSTSLLYRCQTEALKKTTTVFREINRHKIDEHRKGAFSSRPLNQRISDWNVRGDHLRVSLNSGSGSQPATGGEQGLRVLTHL